MMFAFSWEIIPVGIGAVLAGLLAIAMFVSVVAVSYWMLGAIGSTNWVFGFLAIGAIGVLGIIGSLILGVPVAVWLVETTIAMFVLFFVSLGVAEDY